MPDVSQLNLKALVQVITMAGAGDQKSEEYILRRDVTAVMSFGGHIYSLSEYIWQSAF
jgi:hypothetical protein